MNVCLNDVQMPHKEGGSKYYPNTKIDKEDSLEDRDKSFTVRSLSVV